MRFALPKDAGGGRNAPALLRRAGERGNAALEAPAVQRDKAAIAPCRHYTAVLVGMDVDQLGRVRNAQGRPQDNVFVVGSMTKGEAWETVAVPDIRRQVWDLARYLSDTHGVGGEGFSRRARHVSDVP